MKENDLITNIQQARQHIKRLKKQAQIIDNSLKNPTIQQSQEQSFSLNQYVNNALYSLAKNQTDIQGKVQDYKSHKLPSINKKNKKQDSFYLKGYEKKHKIQIKKPIPKSKVNSFSTKADDSFSLAIENRKVKIYSHHEKHKVGEINSQSNLGSNINFQSFIAPQNYNRDKQVTTHSSIRKRKPQPRMKFINLNDSTIINQDHIQKSMSKRVRQEKMMEYESVVDSFSNHVFMIINGNTAVESPEFISYQRIYKSIFSKIQQEIRKIQQIVKQYGISYARFDGKKLAYLCLKQQIKKSQLIDCLMEGRQQILSKMPETKYKGAEGKVKAVNKIIAYWRMINVRTKYKILKQNTIKLQRFFKRKNLMLNLQRKIIKRNQQIVSRFQQRQSKFQKNYKKIKTQKRIQIHLNSMEMDEEKRLTIENFSERQNIQLPRIFQLRDQNLILIYVSSKQISQQLINYYYKILQLSNIQNYKDRLFFINPRDYKFPQHFSTSKLVYYCSRTLNQLRQITADLPTILYAGHPCNELIKICDFIDCYLFSGQPNKMRQFMTKSQTKRLLKNLCIQTLPGSMQMYDYGEFLNTFSVLIIKNPEIQTWVLKIDDQFGGRGIAYVQLSKSKVIMSLLKKIEYQINSDLFTTDIITEPGNQQVTIKIRDYLKQKLCQRLVIATPSLYRNYQEYMGRFIKKGGIIQAHPPCPKQNLAFPSVSFCLKPDGQFNIISTYEKISSQPYRNIACSFPQKSLEYQQILSLCRQLVQSFKIRKLFGNFTIDLICFQKEQQMKYWVLDIEPFLNDYSCSFYLFDGLMEGSYIQDKNIYLTQVSNSTKQDNTSSLNTLATQKQQSNLEVRQYIFIPHFLNKDFSKINIKQFFKQARIQKFNFDIADKHGVCMLLFDELTSGQMGLMTVSDGKQKCVEKLKKVLEFIARITTVKNSKQYGRSELEPSTDVIHLNDVMSKFLTLQRREKRRQSKKKAHSQYQNNQNLQLII